MQRDPARNEPGRARRYADLLAFRRCGLTPEEAAKWATAGVGPYDAEAAVSVGLSAGDRVVARAVPGSTLPAKAGWAVAQPRGGAVVEGGSRHRHRATITVSEIAELAGARRSIVSHWRKGKRQFPEPLIGGRSPQFDLGAVLRWMEDHDKLVSPPDALWHWKRQVRALPLVLAGVDRASLRGFVAALVATVSLIEDPAPHLGTTQPGRALRRLAAEVEAGRPDWHGVLVPLLGEIAPGSMAAALADLVPALLAALGEGCPPAGVLDEALTALNASGTGRTVTDLELAELLTGLLGAEPGERVLDPACGEGQLLTRLAMHGRRSLRLIGVELDPIAAGIASTRLLLRGLDAAVITGDALRIRFDGAHDRVIVDPPLQERSAPAHLWLRLASRYLTGSGRAVVVTAIPSVGPNSAALRVVADHGGGAIVPASPAFRADARTGLAVCVLPGRDRARGGRVLVTPLVDPASRATGGAVTGEPEIGQLRAAVERWLEQESLTKPDLRRGVRVAPVGDLVEAGVERLITPTEAGPAPSGVPGAARRLMAELDAAPRDTAADQLREALRQYLAATSNT